MSTTTSQPAERGAFAKYKALVFDCYGTLIDWETGIYTGLKPLFEKSGKPSDKRTVIQAFISVESDLQAQHPSMLYTDLLAKVYSTLEARLQNKPPPPDALRDDVSTGTAVVSSAHNAAGTQPVDSAPVGTSAQTQETATRDATANPAEAFAHSVETWAPFPDTVPALATLAKHFKLVILSNIDRATISKTRKLLERDFAFDAVYTAEDAGAYKPAPEMLTYALAHLEEDFGIEQGQVLMTAQSVFHDIIPAKARGIATSWINRDAVTGADLSEKGNEATFVFPTLGAMADAVEKANA